MRLQDQWRDAEQSASDIKMEDRHAAYYIHSLQSDGFEVQISKLVGTNITFLF